MTPTRRFVVLTGIAPLLPFRPARAAKPVIRIGVLGDQSSLYKDLSGPVAIACVKQAVQDLGPQDFDIEVIAADHQNKPDVGVAIARRWFDVDGVDMITDVPNSAVALAVSEVTREKNKAFINAGAGTTELTGSQCSPNTIHWTYDTWMLAHSTGKAMVERGAKSWFFITADYAFGASLERETASFVAAAGGKVLGSVRHPVGTSDFSSFLLQAKASRADVVAFCNAGGDTINCVKQAAEFGIARGGTQLSALLIYISDVHSLGLRTAQGLVLSSVFYWILNDRTRAFSDRLSTKVGNVRAGMNQAGCYSATLHYLKAVKSLGALEARRSGQAVVQRMKAMPSDDDCFGQGRVREDGRAVHDCYLFQVKTPEESRSEWDCFKRLAQTTAEQAFRPMTEGNCPLVRP